jgi:hypothetical protein
MTKRVILHIGTAKTGTTSLQKFLSAHEAELGEAGVLYPRAGRPEWRFEEFAFAHHVLALAIRGRETPADARHWDDVREELARSDKETAVISSENFGGFEPEHVRQAAAHLEGHTVKVVVYLRSPLSFLVSAYKQRVKVGQYGGSFGGFVREYVRFGYGDLLARWADVFGAENVLARVYDKVKKSPGVEEDFLDVLGVSPSKFPAYFAEKPRANVSPPDDAVMLMRRLNACKEAWGPRRGAGLFDRARIAVWHGTAKGRALLTICRPFLRGGICRAEDVEWLREKGAKLSGAKLDPFLPEEDRAYFRL